MYKVILSVNGDNLNHSFSINIPFMFFSCIIALVKNSSTILNKSGER
jgi:hypothetical protein